MSEFDFDDLFSGMKNPAKPGTYAHLQEELRRTKKKAEGMSSTPKEKKPEKSLPWNAKVLDGKYYVPLEQVAELLEINGVLPGVAKGLRRRTDG